VKPPIISRELKALIERTGDTHRLRLRAAD
jgi:hypothetical protein